MYINYSEWETFEYKVSSLQLDVNNPRIRYNTDNMSQTQILKLLIDNEKIDDCRNVFVGDVWNDFYSDSYYKVMLERLVDL